MSTRHVDERPYVDFTNYDGWEYRVCKVCYEPIWRPHRDGCTWWQEYLEEPEPEWVAELVVVFALLFASVLLGTIVRGFL